MNEIRLLPKKINLLEFWEKEREREREIGTDKQRERDREGEITLSI